MRLTLVRPQDMMNKKKHSENAFFYSCWGANPVTAKSNELGKDRYGFSLTGSDGDQHNFGKGYYQTDVTIPSCVPDGDYVLGWVWYGGIGSSVLGNVQQKPTNYGYFGDYWSCSYVRIQGGVPLSSSCSVIFRNDMSKYSSQGCMSSADAPGVCAREPCLKKGTYQMPKSFKNGSPPLLTPQLFGGASDNGTPRNSPSSGLNQKTGSIWLNSCKCIAMNSKCSTSVSSQTNGRCRAYILGRSQSSRCRDTCCSYCRNHSKKRICRISTVRKVCRN